MIEMTNSAVRPRNCAAALRVLVAEDNPTNQLVLKLILDCAEVDVDCVENGAEAVSAARDGHYDVIFMDVQMPVMDGLTAIRLIRDHERSANCGHTPIFTVTANALPEHAKAAITAGADQQITKPISPPVIFRALKQAQQMIDAA